MQEFIVMGGLPYLLHGGRAYAVRWDDKGFTVGGIVREGISSTDFPILSELSVRAKCQGQLDSIGKEAAQGSKPKRSRKAKGETE